MANPKYVPTSSSLMTTTDDKKRAVVLLKTPKKQVIKLYWTYGENHQPLTDESRHYVDMNLHIETTNYAPGESIEVTITSDDGDIILNKKTILNITGVVDSQGMCLIEKPFKDGTLNLG